MRKEGLEFFKPNAEELAYWQSVGETAAKELMDRGTFSKVNYDAMMAALAAARGQ